MAGHDFDHLASELEERVATSPRGPGIGGLAWAVARGGTVTHGSAGWLDVEHQRRVENDSIFRVASISKPIAAVAALQLVESETLGLDEPLDRWLPELADRQVLVDPSGPIDGDTVAAERPLTLQDLLTSRCGLGMDFNFGNPQPVLDRLWEWGIGPGPTPPDALPDRFMELLGQLPLSDQPGTNVRYHTSFDILSVLLERVHGQGLDLVLARDVFEPLGMVDTSFYVPTEKQSRFGVARRCAEDGSMVVWDEPDGRWAQPPVFNSGAAGLVSTTADLVAFGQLLLGSRPASARTVLAPELVKQMVTDQLSDQQAETAGLGEPGGSLGWGFGIGVWRKPGPGGWPPVGAATWDGGSGCRFLVVPELDLCAVLLLSDDFSSPAVPPLLDEFVTFVGAAAGQSPP